MYHIVLTRYQRGNQYSQIVTTKTECKLLCSGRVISSCSTRVLCRVTLITDPVFRHEWWKDREELATSGTYLWSFVTVYIVIISTWPMGTLGAVASLSPAIFYQGILIGTTCLDSSLLFHNIKHIYILLFTMESYPTPSFVLVVLVLYAVSTMLPMSLDCPFFNAPSVFFLTFN